MVFENFIQQMAPDNRRATQLFARGDLHAQRQYGGREIRRVVERSANHQIAQRVEAPIGLLDSPVDHELLMIETQFAKRQRRRFAMQMTARLSVQRHLPVGHALLEHVDDETDARIDGAPAEEKIEDADGRENGQHRTETRATYENKIVPANNPIALDFEKRFALVRHRAPIKV